MASVTPVILAPVLAFPAGSDVLYEIVDGERREVPRMGVWAGLIASRLATYLNAHAIPRKVGVAIIEVLFRLTPDGPSRRPDVSFIAYDRWPWTSIPADDPPELEFSPNLAVEVVSPSNSANEIEDKVEDYFAAGVQLVWVIYPRHRKIYVYQSPTQDRILREADELEGGNVVPGFRLKVADLFEPVAKPA